MHRRITRKSILDINEDVTIGVAFPLNEVNLFKGTKTLADLNGKFLISLILRWS